jgi:hypothetical protein
VAAEPRELSPEEIDAVSGAWSVELFGFTVTGSDVASEPSGCGGQALLVGRGPGSAAGPFYPSQDLLWSKQLRHDEGV